MRVTDQDLQDREFLIDLRVCAEYAALCEGVEGGWARAYLALANAADHLDAMRARTNVVVPAPMTP